MQERHIYSITDYYLRFTYMLIEGGCMSIQDPV